MSNRILVFYGSYRSDRFGIRLANFVVEGFRTLGDDVELIDAKAVDLPMLDRMYKEYPKGAAPAALEKLASQIRAADGFVFITGEYNWGVQPGLKNLTDHFLEEWFWRPAAIACYSAGQFGGVRAAMQLRALLPEIGMPSIPSILALPKAQDLFDEMYASLADRSTRQLLNRLARLDVLLIDEFGYLNLKPEQSNIFFKLMEERYRRRPTIITTNLVYDEWPNFLGNRPMVEALLSRLQDVGVLGAEVTAGGIGWGRSQ